jgi:thymidylate synthase
MIAQACKLNVGELTIVLGDAHIYENHIDQVKEQIARKPFAPPKLQLNPEIVSITEFTMEAIELVNYQSHEAITAPMAV